MLIIIWGALYDGLPLIPLAIAFVWTLRYQRIADLSLAGSFSVAAGCCAYALNTGINPWLSVTLGLLIGALIGLAMGFTVNVLRIEPLLSGLVVLFITYAVSLGITEGTIQLKPDQNPLEALYIIEKVWDTPLWMHPAVNLLFLLVALTVALLTVYVLATEWGCAFRALEDQEGGRPFLNSLGLSPTRLSLTGFAVAGLLASISGILIAFRDHQTTSSLGLETLIDTIPAYLLGLTLFEKRPTLRSHQGIGDEKSLLKRTGQYLLRVSRYVKLLPPALAAGIGCLVFFFVINLSQRGAVLSWLPRVIVGLILIGMLGLRPALDAYRQRHRQAKSTHVRGAHDSLRMKDVTVSYPTTTGPKHVLRGVNLTINPGEIVQLKGPNGAGKSTLLRALADRINCTGEFYIPVVGATRRGAHRASLVAYVPQYVSENMAVTLSIAEQAVLASRGFEVSLFRMWKRSAVSAVRELKVDDVAPDSSTLVQWLSGGQKRRVLLALLAVRNRRPLAVALDEPFNDLDSQGRAHCAEIIRRLAEEGCAVLLIDHQSLFKATREADNLWLDKDARAPLRN